jgi:hypothetical protein
MGTRDPRVDAYIAKQNDFAKPILEHGGGAMGNFDRQYQTK